MITRKVHEQFVPIKWPQLMSAEWLTDVPLNLSVNTSSVQYQTAMTHLTTVCKYLPMSYDKLQLSTVTCQMNRLLEITST